MAIRKATGEGDNGLLQIVLALCTIPACVGMVASARNAYRMRGRGRESGALLLPALLGCVWLLESYRRTPRIRCCGTMSRCCWQWDWGCCSA